MRSLSGKVAVVTGGGSGIGLATATHLARAGVTVVIVDLDRASAERVAGGARGTRDPGGRGSLRGVAGHRRKVTARFGGIDLAHLNAGVTTGEADITKVTDAIYRRAVGCQRGRGVLRGRALVPGTLGPRWRCHRGHRLAGRPDRVLARPHLLPDQARRGRSGPLPRSPNWPSTRSPSTRCARASSTHRSSTMSGTCSRGAAFRSSTWPRCHRRWSSDCRERRPATPWSSRPVGSRRPSGSPGLLGRGPAEPPVRCHPPRWRRTIRPDRPIHRRGRWAVGLRRPCPRRRIRPRCEPR